MPLGRCRGTGGYRSYTVACRATVGHLKLPLKYAYSLLTFPLLISEHFWFCFDIPSDDSIFSTFAGEYKNIALAEKRGETQKSKLISKVNKASEGEHDLSSPPTKIWYWGDVVTSRSRSPSARTPHPQRGHHEMVLFTEVISKIKQRMAYQKQGFRNPDLIPLESPESDQILFLHTLTHFGAESTKNRNRKLQIAAIFLSQTSPSPAMWARLFQIVAKTITIAGDCPSQGKSRRVSEGGEGIFGARKT